MTLLALLRHAETDWTLARRIQGRTDVPLSETGRARLGASVLPGEASGMRVFTSPLIRCTETASLLGFIGAIKDSRLIEMHWGTWEGRTLTEIRVEEGESMLANEARGWDFTPDGGESPRQVLSRMKSLLTDIASDGRP